jgi:hypothetical protein
MTSWGNTKQRAAFWAAAAFFVGAIFCANTPNLFAHQGFALLGLGAGLICFIGVWTLGFRKSADPDCEQW